MRREWDLANKILKQYCAIEFIKLSAKTTEMEETTKWSYITYKSFFKFFDVALFYLFNKYLLSTYFMPDIILSSRSISSGTNSCCLNLPAVQVIKSIYIFQLIKSRCEKSSIYILPYDLAVPLLGIYLRE